MEVSITHPRCVVSRCFPVAAPLTGVPQNHRFCQRSQVKLHGVQMALTSGEHGVGLRVRVCKGSGLPPSYGLARATHIPVQSSVFIILLWPWQVLSLRSIQHFTSRVLGLPGVCGCCHSSHAILWHGLVLAGEGAMASSQSNTPCLLYDHPSCSER